MFEINIVTLGTIIGTISSITIIIGSVIRLGWSIKRSFSEMINMLNKKLDDHEDKDQRRHEENIERFAKVETKLNIIMENGH